MRFGTLLSSRGLAWGIVLALLLALGCARAGVERATAPAFADAPRLVELGGHGWPITTTSAEAQRYFDQGLLLSYGFNHEAAIRSFAHAAKLDPDCAACWWGIALAHGPNINVPMGPEGARAAWAALREAEARAPRASAKEQALIAALAERYTADAPEDRAHLDRAYATAMRGVQQRWPQDVDVAVLTAEALMDLYPWNYWTEDAQPREHTEEIVRLLEFAMAEQPRHVGANHYYIHATEEYFPEKAEPAADRLGPVAPDAGHLVHMPSHIYWRVGRYQDALEINVKAAEADERYFAWCRPGQLYSSLYYPHNVHFLWAAAAAEGRRELALASARKLEASVEDKVAEFPFVEEFLVTPELTLARFGQWDALLGVAPPPAGRVFEQGIWHYVRGLARVRLGDPAVAEAELAKLRAQQADPAAEKLVIAGGTAPASQILAIAVAHLEGELAASQGRFDGAVAALERGVELQDGLVYMEPPPWYFPMRQALGAVLLDAGRAAQAEAVYRADLAQYPKNGWSLHGLWKSLEAQRKPEASWAERGHKEAFARADVTLEASRF